MKKLVIAISCIALIGLTSCKGSKMAPQNFPTGLSKLFPGVSNVDWDNEKDGTWEAEFVKNGIKTSVTFNNDGSLKEVEEKIELSQFPVPAQNYIKSNFPNKKMKDISKMTDSKGVVTYEAEVDDQDLIFDAQGNFLKIENEDKEDAKTATTTTEASTTKVDVRLIPQTVHDFVAKNYPGYKIESAEHDPMCNGYDAIDVAIRKPGSAAYSVIFSPKWDFIQQEEDVALDTAPENLKSILKTKFADFKVDSQIEKLTLADKKIQYTADLSKNGSSKEVVFDEKGNVVCSH
jgi:hypothetical protein